MGRSGIGLRPPRLPRGMPADRTPGGRDYALPRGFNCAMCGAEVKEQFYGQGFGKCGALQGDKEYALCAACLDLMIQTVKAGREQMIDILRKAGMTITLAVDEEKGDGI